MKLLNTLDQLPVIQQLKEKYELLQEKDRRALSLLSIALVVAVFYFMVWEPVAGWSSSQEAEYKRQLNTYEWMQVNAESAKQSIKKQKSGMGQKDLSSVVSSTSRQAGLVLHRVQPDRKGLGVWIEDAAYQKLLMWLITLNTRYQIDLQQVKIEKGKEEGRVKAVLHLAR
ncbi:hypothetical protein EOPP23_16695 [Endozoicomonas sp. OPT23]|uniref:type II secretion system protein GspM n=1 Tax=Endozoicomonas sp. OPT23 TaxID=2072845 RepID=UPI00129B384A|nr:type II secretion system protein M [Endozoicomonas sp. OPT23]MRI34623.1 hypothetical protein [Endozoicomonas sp. OPT23]